VSRRAHLHGVVAFAVALLSVAVATAPAGASLVKLFALPQSLKNPYEIASGPDGALWFTQYDVERDGPQASILGRITTAGAATAVRVPAGSEPLAIASGPDAALWYAAGGRGGGRIGRVTTAAAGEYPLPRGSSSARGIVTGPDGGLWFTTQQRIGRFTPGEGMTFFAVPRAKNLQAIVRGPDDALWFSDRDAASIGRMTTAGAIRRFRLPVGANVAALTAGADGAVWFVTDGPSRLGRITTAGRIRMYGLPQRGNVPVDAVAAGPDGATWFIHLQGIGRITPGGEITELAVPQPDDEFTDYRGLASGPDGAIWFGANWFGTRTLAHTRGEIGRIDVTRHPDQLLITRIAERPLRGRGGHRLRVSFTASRGATGSLRLDLGRKRAIARTSVRAQAGANTVTIRLPSRPGHYRLVLRLSLGQRITTTSIGALHSQSGSDTAPLTVTRSS